MHAEKVRNYLRDKHMYFEDIDFEECCTNFMEEMHRGLEGSESSLRMIPTYIEGEGEIPVNTPVIAMDAGGTNFRVAVVVFNEERNPRIEKYSVYEMPGVAKRVGKSEFFDIIARYMDPVVNRSDRIGFCFSYPTEILPNRDGRLVFFSKEIKAAEVIGELIGENLNATLSRGGRDDPKKIVLLNDTVATLLAGRAFCADREYDGYIGYILGTGNNCCYIEENVNIRKKTELDPGRGQIINTESGNFSKSPRGMIDKVFDDSTINPGDYSYEKMVSGAYFGGLCSACIGAACNDGLLSDRFRGAYEKVGVLDTKGINDFMMNPGNNVNPLARALKSGNADDGPIVYLLIDYMIWRAALLAAVPLASVMLKSGRGKDPCKPVCITAEGSVFYGLKSLRRRTESFLEYFTCRKNDLYFEVVEVENAALIGAAIAGLLN